MKERIRNKMRIKYIRELKGGSMQQIKQYGSPCAIYYFAIRYSLTRLNNDDALLTMHKFDKQSFIRLHFAIGAATITHCLFSLMYADDVSSEKKMIRN